MNIEFTAQKIAAILDGTCIGNEHVVINSLAKIEEGKAGAISFLSNDAYTQYIYTCQSSAVIVDKNFVAEKPLSTTLIVVNDARQAFAKLLEAYNNLKTPPKGIHANACIETSAKVGKEVYIGAMVYVGSNSVIENNCNIYPQVYIGENVTVGANTTIYAGAKIYSDSVIGENCTIHAGAIIGSDGFGFAPSSNNGVFQKVYHIGNVILENNVEIGANTTIDKATMGSTVIKKGAKLDNLIQIAHNVEIGENTVIAAQTGIAGSTKIGANCMIGGQVGIVGHITIANGVKIAAQSGIGQSITTENEIVQGSPAFSIGDYKRSYILFKNLPQLNKKIGDLEKNLSEK
jgi:UDP-3-O-[3-hydroxymyristoyl] glucosamine N-acyltransferase